MRDEETKIAGYIYPVGAQAVRNEMKCYRTTLDFNHFMNRLPECAHQFSSCITGGESVIISVLCWRTPHCKPAGKQDTREIIGYVGATAASS